MLHFFPALNGVYKYLFFSAILVVKEQRVHVGSAATAFWTIRPRPVPLELLLPGADLIGKLLLLRRGKAGAETAL